MSKNIIAKLTNEVGERVTVCVAKTATLGGNYEVFVEGGVLSGGEDCMVFELLTDALEFAGQELAQVLWQVEA